MVCCFRLPFACDMEKVLQIQCIVMVSKMPLQLLTLHDFWYILKTLVIHNCFQTLYYLRAGFHWLKSHLPRRKICYHCVYRSYMKKKKVFIANTNIDLCSKTGSNNVYLRTFNLSCHQLTLLDQFAPIYIYIEWKENHTTIECCQNIWKFVYTNSPVILAPSLAL